MVDAALEASPEERGENVPYTLQSCGHPWADYNRDHGNCMLCEAGKYREARLAEMGRAAAGGAEGDTR